MDYPKTLFEVTVKIILTYIRVLYFTKDEHTLAGSLFTEEMYCLFVWSITVYLLIVDNPDHF